MQYFLGILRSENIFLENSCTKASAEQEWHCSEDETANQGVHCYLLLERSFSYGKWQKHLSDMDWDYSR